MKKIISKRGYLFWDFVSYVMAFAIAFFMSQTARYGISNPFSIYEYGCLFVFQILLIVVFDAVFSAYRDLRKSAWDVIATNLIKVVSFFLLITSLMYAFKLSDRISRYFFVVEYAVFLLLSTVLKVMKFKALLENNVRQVHKKILKKKEHLRIAMFGHKRVPSREGGVEIVVEELARRMVARGHSVVLYNRNGNNVAGKQYNSEQLDSYKGIDIKRVWTIDAKGMAAMTSSLAATLCTMFRPYDIVHIHCEGPAFFCRLLKIAGKRVIVTIHGLDYKRAKWGRFASWYLKKGEENAVKFADEIIVLSEAVQKYFMDTYGRETVYIANGVAKPEKVEAKEIKDVYGLDKDEYILYLGRIVPEKGVHYLIEAYKKINTDKKLVIAGGSSDSAEYFDELKSMAKEDNRIIFTDFVQGRVLEELYSNVYVYVLPSDLEGMPLSLLEAMSYGNCCLVSDIDECASVVGECGVLFSRSNTRDLKEKLQKLIDDSDVVEQYKAVASDYICGKYNWDNICDKTVEMYCRDE